MTGAVKKKGRNRDTDGGRRKSGLHVLHQTSKIASVCERNEYNLDLVWIRSPAE